MNHMVAFLEVRDKKGNITYEVRLYKKRKLVLKAVYDDKSAAEKNYSDLKKEYNIQ